MNRRLNETPVIGFFIRYFKRNMGQVVGLLLMCTIVAILTPKFLTKSNLLNLLKNCSVNAMLTCALSMVILLGFIDISVGSTVGLAGIVSATLITNYGWPVVPTVVVCLLIGVAVGVFNGFFIANVGVPPFITTLVTQCLGRGLAQVICDGNPIRVRNDAFTVIGNTTINGLSIIVLYALIALIITTIILYKTKFGGYIYAVGGNRTAADYTGINSKKVIISVYVISGVLAAFCGIVWAARLGSATPTLGANFELDAIAATALGGASMSGGVLSIGGSILGILMIGVITNGLNLLSVNSFWQYVAKGVIIIIAVVIDIVRKNREDK